MTEEQAVDRARHIWGPDATVTELLPSGGAALLAGNTWHNLDAHGHPACHSKCEDLEAEAEVRDALSFRQLVSEALALLDREDPDHDRLDVKDWCQTAKALLARTRPA